MRKAALGVLAAAALTGCAPAAHFVQPVAKKNTSVELNARSMARVGDSMLSEHDYIARPGAVIQGKVSGVYAMARYNVPAGTPLVESRRGDAVCYCTQGPMVFSMVGIPLGSACFQDERGAGSFNMLGFSLSGPGFGPMEPVPYKLIEVMDSSSFKADLTYQGVAQNVLHMSYRESGGDPARPTVAQDLNYTLSRPDDEITFRGVRIKVHSANNNQIEYTVLSGMNR